jgi:hypothetical protein
MVAVENDRKHPSTAPPYERSTQDFQRSAETTTEPPRGEEPMSVPLRDPIRFTSLVVSGATISSMWGLGALVLAILGLCGLAPIYLSPIAGMALGLAFLFLGGVGLAWARMFRFAEQETRWNRIVFSSGVTMVLIAGLAGIFLSILNLVFLAAAQFGAVAIIVLGGGLLWHSGVMYRVRRFTDSGMKEQRPRSRLGSNALLLAPVRDFLLGIGSVALGILALLGLVPMVLEFAALLALGGALTLTASTLCGATLFRWSGVCSKS